MTADAPRPAEAALDPVVLDPVVLDSARYKQIVAGIAAAAEDLRLADRERAAGLSRDLAELDAAMLTAGGRAGLSRLGVELSWERAMEMLWGESWMTLRRRPAPDPRTEPADLDVLDAAVEKAVAELQGAVRRRRFGLRRG